MSGATIAMHSTEHDHAAATQSAITTLGVVRYLNTRPLIAGLESLQGLQMNEQVPAALIGLLERGEVHAALCSSIDYQRSEKDLVVLPVGLLGCEGQTLTVKIFSRVPFNQVRRLHADADSHTSRVLAQLIFTHRFDQQLEMMDGVPTDMVQAQALLLIGDKVVLQAPDAQQFPYQLDLGEAWHEATELPFTFACWMALAPQNDEDSLRLRTLAAVLDHQRLRNAQRLQALAAIDGPPRGWPVELASRYLSEHLRFTWNAQQQRGLALFWHMAHAAGHLSALRPLQFL